MEELSMMWSAQKMMILLNSTFISDTINVISLIANTTIDKNHYVLKDLGLGTGTFLKVLTTLYSVIFEIVLNSYIEP